VTSQLCAKTIHVELPSPKLSCGEWGGVPDVVNKSRFVKTGYRVSAPWEVEFCRFMMLSAIVIITG